MKHYYTLDAVEINCIIYIFTTGRRRKRRRKDEEMRRSCGNIRRKTLDSYFFQTLVMWNLELTYLIIMIVLQFHGEVHINVVTT